MFYKVNPSIKDSLWAGEKLKSKYHKSTSQDKISETWEFSINDSGYSTINCNGEEITLREYMKNNFAGKNLNNEEAKVLIKLIDSADSLSIQVHPSDDYALANYGKLGKTEMWYILEAEEDAFIYLGFKEDYEKSVVEEALNNGTICDLLNKIYVHPGDFYSIPSGTIHAIGKGVTLYEIQENSDLTFRLYDFDRVDKDGNKRELHINEALAVLNYQKYEVVNNKKSKSKLLTANKYFELSKFNVYSEIKFRVNDGSFNFITVIKGQLNIGSEIGRRGDSFYVDPNTDIVLNGKAELLIARIGDYGVGLDVGGTSIKSIVIDDMGFKLADYKVPTESEEGLDKIISNMALAFDKVVRLSGIPKNYFKKVGVGFPGSVDSNTGIVILSNNLGLRNAHIKELLEKEIGVSVVVGNDANCAALGEYIYTDKRRYHDMVLITLGTGVGSGIIINSKLFVGGQGSVTELGHIKIKSDSYRCTCGQYGCFESLLSLARLKKDVDELREDESTGLKELISDTDSPLKIFSLDETNEAAKKYVNKYQSNLLLGLLNICNIFQPQAIVIGGGVSYVVSKYFPIIESKMNKYKFGGFDSPKIRLFQAKLGNEAGGYGAVALTKVE